MRIISDRKTFKRGVLLYRKIRYRKGHGVHSPFVFNFITKVIDERASYYCLDDIELTRKKIFYRDRLFPPSANSNVEIVNSEEEVQITDKLIKPKYGALLMRITNYFKPQTLLQIGSDGGFTSLYLAAFNSAICCVVLEEKPEIAAFARFVIEKQGYKNILLQEGSYKKTIPLFLANTNKLDFVYFSEQNDVFLNSSVFDRILPYLHEESFLVIRGIRKTKEKKEFWNRLCARAEVRVTIDVYELGIVFFNPKIHKRNYIVSF